MWRHTAVRNCVARASICSWPTPWAVRAPASAQTRTTRRSCRPPETTWRFERGPKRSSRLPCGTGSSRCCRPDARRPPPVDSPAMQGYLFSSESVTEGHPDKLADQISDAVLDSMLNLDPTARVACETLVTTGVVFVSGEITLKDGYVDIPSVVREQ